MVSLAARADIIGDCASTAGALPQVVPVPGADRRVWAVPGADCRVWAVPGADCVGAANACASRACQRQRVDRTTPPIMNAKPMSKFQFPIALIRGTLPLVM
jgi:hypothetical protein